MFDKNLECYINGEFVIPYGNKTIDCIDPSSEESYAKLQLGNDKDVDRAVEAAKNAFKKYQYSTRESRVKFLENMLDVYKERYEDLVDAIILELGCPEKLAREAQIAGGLEHIQTALKIIKKYNFEQIVNKSKVKKVPIGVCGIITPWNWPITVFLTKFLPAICTGCTVVWKPAEASPLTSQVLAEIIDASGLPDGVFNMVYGSGDVVGEAISLHKDIQMVSFTGSKQAGVAVQKNGADSIKRVIQELGGKSPNIILPSAHIESAVKNGVISVMTNSGQTCSAPTRMLVENSKMDMVKHIIQEMEDVLTVGNPRSGAFIGPVINKNQFKRVQEYIKSGIKEGAEVIIGGEGKPDPMEDGYYVKPTVFMNTNPEMKIVKDEIFGPVLVIQGYDTIAEAIELAIDTDYGLAAYIQGTDREEMECVADAIPAGQIYFNNSDADSALPFGGFKQSGNGREWGEPAFDEYLEYKALVGYYI